MIRVAAPARALASIAGLALALASIAADPPPDPARPELIGNGSFTRGSAGWETIPGAPGNRVAIESAVVDRLNPFGRITVGRGPARHGANRPRLVHKNQGLTRLEPATEYVLAFRAWSNSRRRLGVSLAQPQPPRSLGLDTLLQVGGELRGYDLEFRTPASMPAGDRAERWLSFVADTAVGDVWIDDVSLRRKPALLIGRNTASRTIAAFGTDAWTATVPTRVAGTARVVEVPANGMVLVSLERPVPLPDDEPWDFELRIAIPHPERVGRISLLARSGEDRALDHALASTSAVERGVQVLRFPREHFAEHWYSAFRWRDARTLAIRLEANGAGPLSVTLEHLAVAPRPSDRAPAPVPTYVGIEDVTARTAVVEVETDRPASVEVRYGRTPRTLRASSAAPSARHRVAIGDLVPGAEHHARVYVTDGDRIGSSGDLAFRTPPSAPPVPATPRGATLDLGIMGVTGPRDLRRVGGSAFRTVQSYQLASPSANSNDDARRYLDVAAEQGLKVLVGFDVNRVSAGDVRYVTARVRALRDHAAVRGWYLFDEPELHDEVTPAGLRAISRAIKAADPRHPIYVGTSWLDADYPYRGTFDVGIVSHYPIPYAHPGAVLQKLAQARRSGIPFEFSFQAYATDLDHRWPTQGLGPGRFPSWGEMRAMAFIATNHGARGLWAFSYDYLHFTPGAAWKWIELGDLVRELAALEPVLASAAAVARTVGSAPRELDVAVRAHAGQEYVVAVNHTPARIEGVIRVGGAPFTGARRVDARAADAATTFRAGRGEISDRWEPFAVHVYRLAAND